MQKKFWFSYNSKLVKIAFSPESRFCEKSEISVFASRRISDPSERPAVITPFSQEGSVCSHFRQFTGIPISNLAIGVIWVFGESGLKWRSSMPEKLFVAKREPFARWRFVGVVCDQVVRPRFFVR